MTAREFIVSRRYPWVLEQKLPRSREWVLIGAFPDIAGAVGELEKRRAGLRGTLRARRMTRSEARLHAAGNLRPAATE